MSIDTETTRPDLVRRAFRLEWLTAAWMAVEASARGGNCGIQQNDRTRQVRWLARRPAVQRTETGMVAERHLIRDIRRDLPRRRHQALGLAPRRSKAFPRQRPLDVAVLHGQVPLDREVLRRDQLDHFGDFGAQRGGEAR